MSDSSNIVKLLNNLWSCFGRRRRLHFVILFILMIFSAILEVISIGSVIPFLSALTDPEKLFSNKIIVELVNFFGIEKTEDMVLIFSIIFCIAIVISNFVRGVLMWFSIRLSFNTGAELSQEIYKRTLYQPYAIHIARNSSEVINGISRKTLDVISAIIAVVVFASSIVMLIIVMAALIFVNPFVSFAVFGGIGSIYLLIIKLTRKQLIENSGVVAKNSTKVIQSLQEGLGGIRDVIIDGSQDAFCKVYGDADFALKRAQANNQFIGGSPRYIIEAFGMILIVSLAYVLATRGDNTSMQVIPTLGLFALGSQRLLPILQQLFSSWSGIVGGQSSLRDALLMLNQPLPMHFLEQKINFIDFKDNIKLNAVSFRYNINTSPVLIDINMTIKKGSITGFIGSTGGGKSTLTDIIMGLLIPTKGFISVDGKELTIEDRRAFMSKIAHVPQTIYLADATIAENIAFGRNKNDIDFDRVKFAAQQACISETIELWDGKYETKVGERGIQLSGGQRQRIGIARALYKKSEIIVFDEATSALDSETESKVINSLVSLDSKLTIIMVAHRYSTLRNCDVIYKIQSGEIINFGAPEVMLG